MGKFTRYTHLRHSGKDSGRGRVLLTEEGKEKIHSVWLDKVYARYEGEIEADWDFCAIEAKCKANTEVDDEGDLVGLYYLGSVLDLAPSGKYWTCFAMGNIESEAEAERDTAFWESMDKVFGRHGFWVQNGEGDPCDVFAGMVVESAGDCESEDCDEGDEEGRELDPNLDYTWESDCDE